MGKRFVSLLLAALLLVSLMPGPASAASTGKMTVEQLKEKFPAGRYWNGGNANSTTKNPCTHHTSTSAKCTYSGSCGCNSFQGLSIQCMGYADKLGYDFTGVTPRSDTNGWKKTTSASSINNLKAGDIVRYYTNKSKGYMHSIFVTAVSGDNVTFTDCNWSGNCNIRWNAKTTKTNLKNNFIYLRKAPYAISSANLLTMQFHANGGMIAQTLRYKVTTGDSSLNMRKSASLSAGKLTTIPSGTKLTATQTTTADGYTWIKTTYNGYTGWCAISDGLATRIDYYLSSDYIYDYETSAKYSLKWTYGSGGPNGLVNAATLSLQREGYKFLGWSRSADGSTTIFDQDNKTLKAEDIYPDLKNGAKTITLYAIWEETASTISSISVQTMPEKTVYTVGEALDTTGLALTVTYSNGTVETLTEGFSVTGFDSATAGEKELVVTYEDVTTSFTVEVHDAPAAFEILSQPEDAEAMLGENAIFEVEATNAATYQWQYRRSATGSWFNTSLTGYNTPELTVSATAGRNGYQYRCKITDADGNTLISEPATLTIKAELTFTKQPQEQITAVGGNAKFTVSVTGAKAYQWQYRKSETGSWINTALTGYNTAALTVQAIASRNGYQYRCLVTNAVGEQEASKVAALRTFKITGQPTNQNGQIGAVVTFTTQVNLPEDVQYQWQYSRSATGSWYDTSLTGYNTPQLQVEATAARNGYRYRCIVKGTSGSELLTNEVTLTIGGPAVITQQPTDVQGDVDENVQFAVVADNAQSYQWQYRRSASGTWYTTSMTGYNTATLTVGVTKARYGYQYRCKITGADGAVIYSDAATLISGAPKILTQPADKTASAGQNAVFRVVVQGEGITYRWQYARSADGKWINTAMSGYDTDSLTVAATTARNGYLYRCVITDAQGNEIITEPATLTVR